MARGNIIFRDLPPGYRLPYTWHVDPVTGAGVLEFPMYAGEVYVDLYCTEFDGNGNVVSEQHGALKMLADSSQPSGMFTEAVINETGQPDKVIKSSEPQCA